MNLSRAHHVSSLLLLLPLLAGRVRADEPLAEMLRRVPGTANAIAVIDVKALDNSEVAKREGWKDRRQLLSDGASYLPRNVDRIVLASAIDLTNVKNSWTLSLLDLAKDATSAALIKAEGGSQDQVGGREVIWTPRNAYLILLKKRLLAQYTPPNRQELARWLKWEKQASIAKISPFLERATTEIGRTAQLVVAMDLEDALLPAIIKEHLKNSKVLPPKSNLDLLSRLLASIKGFRFTASAQEGVTGTLTIEFGESTASMERFAKPLLMETLTAIGAELEDLPRWDAVCVGTTVVLKGKLTPGSSSRILSLFDLPSGIDDPTPSSSTTAGAPAEARRSPQSIAAASKRYYQSIRTILDDLKAQKATGQSGVALWYGRYARKIDQLPVLDVDPDLLSFSQQLSEALRNISTAYDGVGAASSYRKTLGGGSYNSSFSNVTAADSARIRKQEDIYALKVYRDSWDNIENQLSALRKSLTLKHGVEF